MKRLALLLGLLMALPVFAQNLSTFGNLTAQSASCGALSQGTVLYQLPLNATTVGVTISGTWSGTLQFAASVNGTIWTSISASPLPSGGGVTAATANGTWTIATGGFTAVCVYASTYSSGTVAISMAATQSNCTTAGGCLSLASGGTLGGPLNVPLSTQSTVNGVTSYLGLVGTRAEQPQALSVSSTWALVKMFSFARTAIPSGGIKLVYANYYIGSNGIETSPGTATFQMAIEYPSGTVTQCTINGSLVAATVTGGSNAISDFCGPAIPAGAMFWVRVLYQNAAGVLYANASHYSSTLDCFSQGTTGVPAVTAACSAGGGSLMYAPLAIAGYTSQPSVCIVGDSRVWGLGDHLSDLTGDVGEIARSIGPYFGYTKLASSGVTALSTTTHFTARLAITPYCTHVVDQLGINDLAASTSAATLAGYRTTLAGLWPNAITIGTTLPPETTSTDSWATTTNQTIAVNPTTFNALVRTGISGESNYFDVDYATDPTAINLWPVSPNIFATSGTAGYATTDGIHETSAMNTYVQRSGYVNAAWIHR